ncbi:uncharacterized protein LOC107359396 [Tetranychus urticae]|uniref:uncharacterized protein LOC107359396 n=1 Tax=Tetranychus urticae TaxID=32264 RepID=UPI00077BECDF|nr:uncharacterized protein LOC107359396 [Tetranychus urticae]
MTKLEFRFKEHVKECDYFYSSGNPLLKLPKWKPLKDENGDLIKDENGQPKFVKPVLEFKKGKAQEKIPIVIYSDFECLSYKIKDERENTNPDLKTIKINKHKPYEFTIFAIGEDYKSLRHYTGDNEEITTETFINYIFEEQDKIVEYLEKQIDEFGKLQKLSLEEENIFKNSENCIFCNKLIKDNNIKVRDHCHITGKFRGAAHRNCNINAKISKEIPVYLHNGSKYDFKLFTKKLYARKDINKLDIIPSTEETFFCISAKKSGQYTKVVFKDTIRHTGETLEKMAGNLTSDLFKNVRWYYKDISEEMFNIITSKGVFPYDWMDTFDKLNYEKLPNIECFKNKLLDKDLEEAKYEIAKRVWEYFKCEKFADYSTIYNICDTLLLADCFENYRNIAFRTYKLDPAHFLSAPALSYSAMLLKLKEKDIKPELITDHDMLMLIYKGIRGGLSCINKRHVKGNNKYMKGYDKNKPSSYIIPLDANNLYGYAMSFRLPYKDFKWLSRKEINELDILKLDKDSEIGYIFNVDLEYPKELHDLHNDYPFIPICKEVKEKDLSNYQIELYKLHYSNNFKTDNSDKNISIHSPERKDGNVIKYQSSGKLIASLEDKNRVTLHYLTLKQALENGLKLKKIHKGIKFTQAPILKEYIDLNTNLRTLAKNENKAAYAVGRYNFKRETIIDENLTAIHFTKTKVEFDKPIYLGFSILEISKYIMYDFVYNVVKKIWGKNAEIIQTDTDGILLHIITDDFYKDIKPHIEKYFDTSDYEKENLMDIPVGLNKKKLGCFKDESNGKVINEFIGLRSKMYTYFTENDDEIIQKARTKGIPKHKRDYFDKDIWIKTLYDSKLITCKFQKIGSNKLNIVFIVNRNIELILDKENEILGKGILSDNLKSLGRKMLKGSKYMMNNYFYPTGKKLIDANLSKSKNIVNETGKEFITNLIDNPKDISDNTKKSLNNLKNRLKDSYKGSSLNASNKKFLKDLIYKGSGINIIKNNSNK